MKTSKYDFTFLPAGYGHYRVTYTSPATGKEWQTVINDMELIDAVKNNDKPKRKDLEMLKWLCKNR